MTKTAIVTARLDADTAEALDAFAARRERTRAWIVADAVSRYLEEETHFETFLQEGRDAITRGETLTHDEMVEEIRRWQAGRARRS
ncbi:MAG: ribbon-helix-helix protein, CopG family [Pseudomonadota bacterium]